jgi:hypothetical protein
VQMDSSFMSGNSLNLVRPMCITCLRFCTPVLFQEWKKSVNVSGEIFCVMCAKKLHAMCSNEVEEELGLEIEELLLSQPDESSPVYLNTSQSTSAKAALKTAVEIRGALADGGLALNPLDVLCWQTDSLVA